MIITVAHQKGGTGKSTIAINLAAAMHAHLLDMDVQHSSILWICTREEQIANGKKASITRQPIAHIPCFTLANSGCRLPFQTAIPNDKLMDFLETYSDAEQDIIVDCPGLDGENNRYAIVAADFILTPVGPSPFELYGLQSFEGILIKGEAFLNRTNPNGTPVSLKTHVLINKANGYTPKRTQEFRELVASRPKHFLLCDTVISLRDDYLKSAQEGLSVIERSGNSSSAREIEALVKEIRSKLHNEKKG